MVVQKASRSVVPWASRKDERRVEHWAERMAEQTAARTAVAWADWKAERKGWD